MIDYSAILMAGFYIYVVLTIIFLLLDNRNSSTTFAWIFIFIIFPVGAQILYFLIGRNRRKSPPRKSLVNQHFESRLLELLSDITSKQDEYHHSVNESYGRVNKKKLLNLLKHNSNSILTIKNNIVPLQSGHEKFNRLIEDLKNAQDHIHMEYFIWRSDSLMKDIKQILIEKARSGVEVRLLYDALGSVFLSPWFIRDLRKGGVQFYPYYDFKSPLTIHTLNYRNHRKIAVIDGTIGYTGGMNMGKEYVDGGKQFDFWRDTHLRLEGESVQVLQSIFVTSWLNTTKESLFKSRYFPECVPPNVNETPIQVTTSGPDSQWESIQQLFFMLISSAEKSVYIQSPYFVPDASIFEALKTAALGGLDVKIMVTGRPDKRLPYWSAYTFFEDLLKAGVRIFHYKKGFLHSKTVMVDDEICSIGTANMDMRSFHLNYELSTLIYDRKITENLIMDFDMDLNDCEEITNKDMDELGSVKKFRNSLARLFAPIL